MKDHEGDVRGFHHLSRAWYSEASRQEDNVVDEVAFGFYSPAGGNSGEMIMFWKDLGGKVTPCLEVWNDAWHTLYEFCDVLKELSDLDGNDITPEQFCAILLKCGFIDMTRVKQKEIDLNSN